MNTLTAINLGIRTERTLTNIARRASSLFNDGYHALQTLSGTFVNCYVVTSPKGERYTVKVSKTPAAPGSFYGSSCSCPSFDKMHTCKHLQAIELQEAEDARADAEYERMEECKNFFGFDRYDH